MVITSGLKFYYYLKVRDLMKTTADVNHKKAVIGLKSAEQYGEQKSRERQNYVPALTTEQRSQLNRYLEKRSTEQPDLYPTDT